MITKNKLLGDSFDNPCSTEPFVLHQYTVPPSPDTGFSNSPCNSHRHLPSESYVDYITARFYGRLFDLIAWVKGTTLSQYSLHQDKPAWHGRIFTSHCDFSCGTRILYDIDPSSGSVDACLIMSGRVLQRLGFRGSIRAVWGLSALGCTFSRCDTKARVPRTLIPFKTLEKDLYARNTAGFRKWRPEIDLRWDEELETYIEYKTYYLGSRRSDAYTRIYDPYVKHGVEGYMDFECEFKHAKAQAVADYLCSLSSGLSDEDLAYHVASIALGQIDFIERNGKNLDRAKRRPWWAKLLKYVLGTFGTLRIPAPKYEPCLEKTQAWVERQVMGALGALNVYLGHRRFWAWFHSVLLQRIDHLPSRWRMYAEEDATQIDNYIKKYWDYYYAEAK